MGSLVENGGSLTAETVNREVLEALDQLRKFAHNTSEQKRLAACYMLKELAGALSRLPRLVLTRICPRRYHWHRPYRARRVMVWRGQIAGKRCVALSCKLSRRGSNVRAYRADSCPAVFNVHVRQFVDLIWSGLRDPKLDIRSAAVAALRACLILVEKRETRYRVQWWYNLFEQTMRGLVRPWLKASEREVEAHVHASLLTLGELLQHSGEFMLARCVPGRLAVCATCFAS